MSKRKNRPRETKRQRLERSKKCFPVGTRVEVGLAGKPGTVRGYVEPDGDDWPANAGDLWVEWDDCPGIHTAVAPYECKHMRSDEV